MLTNRFVKSCKSVRLSSGEHVPSKFTQFYARGVPFDVRSAEMEFCLHHAKSSSNTAKTLAALQDVRADINRMFAFFQCVCFMESDVCTISLKAVDNRSEHLLLINTDKFVNYNPPPPDNSRFFWFMVLGPLVIATLTQPSRGSEGDSVRSAVRDLTAAWCSDASRPE